MGEITEDIKEFHWLMEMVQSLDVGLMVLDKNHQITVWNTFMENHSDRSTESVRSKNFFDLFPDVSMEWIRKKIDSVFLLNTRAFSTWEQRPYLLKFSNYHPITGTGTTMFQNISIIPLTSITGKVDHVCLIIYDVTDVACQRKELHESGLQLKILSRTDALTQLNNRGYWEECLLQEYNRYQRSNTPKTVVIFDIDNFKNINDNYGHIAGDLIIKSIADVLSLNQRDTDISGRYGGDEFVVILNNVSEGSARIFAERLRVSIERKKIEFHDELLSVTISLGLAELTKGCDGTKAWIERADKALYYAKEHGRNQCMLYSKLETE